MAKHKSRLNRRETAYRPLNAAFPLAFPLDDADIRPLTLTARDELRAEIESQALDDRTAQTLLRALQNHCSRRTYQQAVANGGMRINLHGEPVEPVTPEGQAHAQARIERILANRAAKATPAPKAKTPKPEPTPTPAPKTPTVIVKKRRRVVLPGS
jgi:sRNA-binding protein